MEDNNGKLIKVIILVLFVTVFLAIFGTAFKMFSFMGDIGKEAFNSFNNSSKNSTDVIQYEDRNYIEYGDGINIYSIFRNIIVFSKNNRLYIANNSTGIITLNDNIFNINNLTFKNNQASFNDPILNSTIYVTDLTINASDVYKVVIGDDREKNDISSIVYILYKEGGLSKYDVSDSVTLSDSKVLSQYNIINIEEECVSSNDFVCLKVEYKLTLKDGSVKRMSNLK